MKQEIQRLDAWISTSGNIKKNWTEKRWSHDPLLHFQFSPWFTLIWSKLYSISALICLPPFTCFFFYFPACEFCTCVLIPPLRFPFLPSLKKPIPVSSMRSIYRYLIFCIRAFASRTYWLSGFQGFKQHALIQFSLCCCIMERELLLVSNKISPGYSHTHTKKKKTGNFDTQYSEIYKCPLTFPLAPNTSLWIVAGPNKFTTSGHPSNCKVNLSWPGKLLMADIQPWWRENVKYNSLATACS